MVVKCGERRVERRNTGYHFQCTLLALELTIGEDLLITCLCLLVESIDRFLVKYTPHLPLHIWPKKNAGNEVIIVTRHSLSPADCQR